MKIALCTTRDLTGNLILNHLLPRLSGHSVAVFLADKRRKVDQEVPELAALWFLERTLPVDLLFPLLDQTTPATAPSLLTFTELHRRHAQTLEVVRTDAEWAGGQAIADWAPDLILSARFGFLFGAPLVERHAGRIFNLHPSALPRYGGQYPVLRALLDGATRLGCTLHAVTTRIDQGAIFDVRYTPVDPGRSHFALRWQTYAAGLAAVTDLVARLGRGEPVPTRPQPETGRSVHGWPDRAVFQACRARGIRLLDSTEYAELLGRYAAPTAGRSLEVLAVDLVGMI